LSHQVRLGPTKFLGYGKGQEPSFVEVLDILHGEPALAIGLRGPLFDTHGRLLRCTDQVFPGLDHRR